MWYSSSCTKIYLTFSPGLPYMLMKKNYIDSFILHEESERGSMRGDNFLSSDPRDDGPLDSDARKDLDDTWTKPFKFQPLWKIRNYFGERIAFYFAWSGMLCTTLWVPSIFGLCVFFYGLYERWGCTINFFAFQNGLWILVDIFLYSLAGGYSWRTALWMKSVVFWRAFTSPYSLINVNIVVHMSML